MSNAKPVDQASAKSYAPAMCGLLTINCWHFASGLDRCREGDWTDPTLSHLWKSSCTRFVESQSVMWTASRRDPLRIVFCSSWKKYFQNSRWMAGPEASMPMQMFDWKHNSAKTRTHKHWGHCPQKKLSGANPHLHGLPIKLRWVRFRKPSKTPCPGLPNRLCWSNVRVEAARQSNHENLLLPGGNAQMVYFWSIFNGCPGASQRSNAHSRNVSCAVVCHRTGVPTWFARKMQAKLFAAMSCHLSRRKFATYYLAIHATWW